MPGDLAASGTQLEALGHATARNPVFSTGHAAVTGTCCRTVSAGCEPFTIRV
jgi:hypothetical protein